MSGAQAAVQMCIKAGRDGNNAAWTFLDNCSGTLRRALTFDGLLLSPVPPGGDPCGATLWWCVPLPRFIMIRNISLFHSSQGRPACRAVGK